LTRSLRDDAADTSPPSPECLNLSATSISFIVRNLEKEPFGTNRNDFVPKWNAPPISGSSFHPSNGTPLGRLARSPSLTRPTSSVKWDGGTAPLHHTPMLHPPLKLDVFVLSRQKTV